MFNVTLLTEPNGVITSRKHHIQFDTISNILSQSVTISDYHCTMSFVDPHMTKWFNQQDLISSADDNDTENEVVGAMAKFKIKKAKTAKERAEIVAEEKRKLKMTKKMQKQQREQNKVRAAKLKEAIKAQKIADKAARELRKEEEIKAKQAVEREMKKSAKKVVEKAVEKELKKKSAGRVCGMEPPKRRGRPPKNLAAAMATADADAATSAKKVQFILLRVTPVKVNI